VSHVDLAGSDRLLRKCLAYLDEMWDA